MKWTHLLYFSFFADRTKYGRASDRTKYGRAYATVLRPSVVCMECMVVKRCILEQKLLLTAYKKSYNMVPK